MSHFSIFFIRLVLGAVFAVFIGRMFYPEASLAYLGGLGLILVGLAYFAEFLRHRKNR